MSRLRKPEVMSPAGYWPQLQAAIEAGADAVYFGLHHFSARAKVGFDLGELPEVMRTLHRRGVRGFLAFNTLVYEHELPEAARAIGAVAEAGIDALIVQDVGAIRLARQIVPELELHASTQTSITSAEGVRFALDLGVQRVTLARELSIEEIASIYASTNADLEIFVHGALCVAYSGQCFSSEAWGGRSANRGQCAQACRLPYELIKDGEREPLADARYLLSPGDLYGLRHVPRIVDAGVSCLKIEGRYKDADYVALTTRAYRQAVDDAVAGRELSVSSEQELQLQQVYSRGLGAYFLSGTDHQAVVRGRAPRHRGICAGSVTRVTAQSVFIRPQSIVLKPGDGVVFDAADWRSPGEEEEGGRIYEALPALTGDVELRFANHAIRFDRIRTGDLLWRTHDPALDRAVKPYLEPAAPVARQIVDVAVTAVPGKSLKTEWTCAGYSVSIQSSKPLETARSTGLSREAAIDQFSRLGGSPYTLGELTLQAEGMPFAPVSVLNQVRRDAVEALQAAQANFRTPEIHPTPDLHRPMLRTLPARAEIHVLVRTPEQLDAAIAARPDSITLDYLDLYGLRPSVERTKAAGIAVRVASPRILKPDESKIANFLKSLDCPILVRSTGLLHTLGEADAPPLIGDFSLNTANTQSAEVYFAGGLTRLTPTHDLNAAQIAALAKQIGAERIEAVVYQHLPVFHTEHCVFCRFLSTGTTYRDCGRPCEKHKVALRDEQGRDHPVIADVGCRNTVFGAEAQEAAVHLDAWRAAGIRHFRLEFVHESESQLRNVVRAFRKALDGETSGAQLAAELRRIAPEGTTEGSLFVPKDYQVFPILQ